MNIRSHHSYPQPGIKIICYYIDVEEMEILRRKLKAILAGLVSGLIKDREAES